MFSSNLSWIVSLGNFDGHFLAFKFEDILSGQSSSMDFADFLIFFFKLETRYCEDAS